MRELEAHLKPLLQTKITRATKDGLGDWIAAADQATDEGRNDFAQRQRERMAQANKERQEKRSHVTIFEARRKGKS
jgi:hypothetical protein